VQVIRQCGRREPRESLWPVRKTRLFADVFLEGERETFLRREAIKAGENYGNQRGKEQDSSIRIRRGDENA